MTGKQPKNIFAVKKEQWRQKPTEQDILLDRKWGAVRKGVVSKKLRKRRVWSKANEYRESVRLELIEKGVIPRNAVNQAWEAMELKFMDYLADEPEQEEPREEEKPEEPEVDFSKLTTDSQPDLARDVLWAYDNLELKGTKPEDAPSVGAWSLLKWAREYRNRFFEQLVPKAMAAKAKQDDSNPAEAADPDIDSVKKLLNSFTKN